jgi:hypothetical protein
VKRKQLLYHVAAADADALEADLRYLASLPFICHGLHGIQSLGDCYMRYLVLDISFTG